MKHENFKAEHVLLLAPLTALCFLSASVQAQTAPHRLLSPASPHSQNMRLTVAILWPSFIAAGIGIGVIFTLVDPLEMVVLGEHIRASRSAIYSLGFFVLWAITAVAAAMSAFLLTGKQPRDETLSGESVASREMM